MESKTCFNVILVVLEDVHGSMTIIDRPTNSSISLSQSFLQLEPDLAKAILIVTIFTLLSSFLSIDLFSQLFSLAGSWSDLAFVFVLIPDS